MWSVNFPAFPTRQASNRLRKSEVARPRDFYMPDDGSVGSREYQGLRKKIRFEKISKAYDGTDPGLFHYSPPAPPYIQAAFDQTFSLAERFFPDGSPRLTLRLHPHTGEWSIWEKAADGRLRSCMRMREWVDEVPDPADVYTSTPRELHGKLTIHLTKFIGAAYTPSRDTFEQLARLNLRRFSIEEIEAELDGAGEARAQRAEEVMADRESDLLDYSWNAEQDRANREAGSGTHMRSVPWDAECYLPKCNPSRWHVEEVKDAAGKVLYLRKRAKTAEEYRKELYDNVSRMIVEYHEKTWGQAVEDPREARGLQRFTPEQREQRRRGIAAELEVAGRLGEAEMKRTAERIANGPLPLLRLENQSKTR